MRSSSWCRKEGVFHSFIPVTEHYGLFQGLHRTILSDSACILTQNSEKRKDEEEEGRDRAENKDWFSIFGVAWAQVSLGTR